MENEMTNDAAVAVEAVAWYTDGHLTDRSATTWDAETAARWEAKGWKVWMLYKGSDVMALQARHEVALDALRGEVERLKQDPLREALHKLVDAADDSDGACYGTLSTSFIRDIAKEALTKESP